jgi:alkanesulfonate monooxygenase SsuD/methylene tetrahydromethanopterin reductase-like flavin-dependent oxidoreductase (luciferase family)
MDIGIGLPNAVHGVERHGIVDWARRAEAAGFASLGTIDRIAYDNYESIVALAAAAAVTERIRLATDILILPLRTNTALFAKQTATIDALSGGRLVLGLAVGGRQDDYALSDAEFTRRGATFERQLDELTELWAGDVVGPAARERQATRHAHWRAVRQGVPARGQVRRRVDDGRRRTGCLHGSARKAQGGVERSRPRGRAGTSALFYFALGPDAEDVAARNLGGYYAFLGDYAQRIVQSSAKDSATLKGYIAAFEQAGADEVIAFPASPDPAQVELLAEAVL